MATKLKDLKFGDYTMKGEKRDGYGDSVFFSLSRQDAIEDSDVGDDIIAYDYNVGCSEDIWHFHGAADFADQARNVGFYGEQAVLFYDYNNEGWKFEGVSEVSNTIKCYSSEDHSVEVGTYKIIVGGSGSITAELVQQIH